MAGLWIADGNLKIAFPCQIVLTSRLVESLGSWRKDPMDAMAGLLTK